MGYTAAASCSMKGWRRQEDVRAKTKAKYADSGRRQRNEAEAPSGTCRQKEPKCKNAHLDQNVHALLLQERRDPSHDLTYGVDTDSHHFARTALGDEVVYDGLDHRHQLRCQKARTACRRTRLAINVHDARRRIAEGRSQTQVRGIRGKQCLSDGSSLSFSPLGENDTS